MITIKKVTSNVQSVPHHWHARGDTRLTLTPSVIHNSHYVIIVSDWNCLKYFCVFLYCNQVYRDFLNTLYKHQNVDVSVWLHDRVLFSSIICSSSESYAFTSQERAYVCCWNSTRATVTILLLLYWERLLSRLGQLKTWCRYMSGFLAKLN
jgi:hypothetical protein